MCSEVMNAPQNFSYLMSVDMQLPCRFTRKFPYILFIHQISIYHIGVIHIVDGTLCAGSNVKYSDRENMILTQDFENAYKNIHEPILLL